MSPTLPEELLQHIFSYLVLPPAHKLADTSGNVNNLRSEEDIQRSQQALFNICLASKTFYRLAWPTLYSAYSSHPIGDRFVAPAYFLRTLCLKPGYGKTLRSLSIFARDRVDNITIQGLYYDHLVGDAMTMALFQWRARNFWLQGREFGDEFQDRLVRSLLIGMDDGIMCMLLLMCPNIAELDIALPVDHEESYLLAELLAVIASPQVENAPSDGVAEEPPPSSYVTSQIFGTAWPDKQWVQPHVLEHLSKLTIRGAAPIDLDAPILRDVTSLSSLKTLRIYRLIDRPSLSGEHSSTAELLRWHTMPQLKKLYLPQCLLGDWAIRVIVPTFPRLRTLDIVWDQKHPVYIAFEEIGQAIARHIPHILELTLDASRCWRDADGAHRMCETLDDSLKNLEYL